MTTESTRAPAEGSLAAITGAASGIGRATAQRLAADGWDVLAIDLDEDGLAKTGALVEGTGRRYVAAVADVADEGAITSALGRAEGRPIEALVNCAGIGVAATTVETTDEDWERVMRTNVTGVFVTCRAVLPGMLDRGSGLIVNIASIAGMVGLRSRAAYCASKAAIVGLTRALAVDHGEAGIRANAVCPGTVETEWIAKIVASSPDPEATKAAMASRQLDGKMGSPEEIAATVALLLSPEGRFFNGSAVVVDGGVTAA